MPATRRSARIASSQDSSPAQPKESPKATAGLKRKSEHPISPTAKRGRKDAPQKQQTLEESMDIDASSKDDEKSASAPIKQNDQSPSGKEFQSSNDTDQATKPTATSKQDDPSSRGEDESATKQDQNPDDADQNHVASDKSADKSAPGEDAQHSEQHQKSHAQKDQVNGMGKTQATDGNAFSAIKPNARDAEVPSSILEKGIIYFFYRGRVGIDDPSNPTDIARSYIVLRPLPRDAKLGDGPITAGEGKCRLLALPKKVLPASGKDRFMTFVEKASTSFAELKKEFLPASDYNTQTAGVRHTPPVTPLAEGIYALTTTGRESHLAYMLTIPTELGEVQKDMGLREKGSFVTSAKNPDYPGPANAQLPQSPDFPQEIKDKFRSLRWMALEPAFLDYENTQFLLIGESGGIENATKPQDGDEKAEAPLEELEKLEGEDEIRVKNLEGNDTVFADLGVSKNDYPKVPTTWES